MFRKSMFGGFNEEDVLNYIRDMHNRISNIEQKFKKNDSASSELKGTRDALSSQLANAQEKISSLEQEIDSLKAENERLKAESEALNARFCEALDSAKGVVAKAHADAEKIMGEAKSVLESAENRAKQIQSEAELASEEVFELLQSAGERLFNFKNKAESLIRKSEPAAASAEPHTEDKAPAEAVNDSTENAVPEPAQVLEEPEKASLNVEDTLSEMASAALTQLEKAAEEVAKELSSFEEELSAEQDSGSTEDFSNSAPPTEIEDNLLNIICNLRAFGADKDK